jgi:hypothetical protein
MNNYALRQKMNVVRVVLGWGLWLTTAAVVIGVLFVSIR